MLPGGERSENAGLPPPSSCRRDQILRLGVHNQWPAQHRTRRANDEQHNALDTARRSSGLIRTTAAAQSAPWRATQYGGTLTWVACSFGRRLTAALLHSVSPAADGGTAAPVLRDYPAARWHVCAPQKPGAQEHRGRQVRLADGYSSRLWLTCRVRNAFEVMKRNNQSALYIQVRRECEQLGAQVHRGLPPPTFGGVTVPSASKAPAGAPRPAAAAPSGSRASGSWSSPGASASAATHKPRECGCCFS